MKSALELTLDEGESEVIALSRKIGADLTIIDEEKARNITKLYKLNVTGTIGVLLYAKKMKKIDKKIRGRPYNVKLFDKIEQQ